MYEKLEPITQSENFQRQISSHFLYNFTFSYVSFHIAYYEDYNAVRIKKRRIFIHVNFETPLRNIFVVENYQKLEKIVRPKESTLVSPINFSWESFPNVTVADTLANNENKGRERATH